jgi:hypothetical protein
MLVVPGMSPATTEALRRIRRLPGMADASLEQVADAIARGRVDPEMGYGERALQELLEAGGLT